MQRFRSLLFDSVRVRFDHVAGCVLNTESLNRGRHTLILMRFTSMNRNIFYIIGVIVVIVIVLKLLGLF